MKAKTQKYLKIIFLITIIGASFNMKGQSLTQKNDFNPEHTEDFIIKDFTGKLINEVVYFKFLVLENQIKADYILESSKDGINFSEIIKKQGHMSPQKTPLLHCYKVEIENSEALYFRIKRIQSDEINFTNTIYINADKELAFYTEK